MGFDLEGIKPMSEKGVYFRNNVWWWRRLWDLICFVAKDKLTEKDITGGSFNDGHSIKGEKHKYILSKLNWLLNEGGKDTKEIKEFIKQSEKVYTRNGEITHPFDWENVEAFYEFISHNKGFQIF